jgi:hypothetical protein
MEKIYMTSSFLGLMKSLIVSRNILLIALFLPPIVNCAGVLDDVSYDECISLCSSDNFGCDNLCSDLIDGGSN